MKSYYIQVDPYKKKEIWIHKWKHTDPEGRRPCDAGGRNGEMQLLAKDTRDSGNDQKPGGNLFHLWTFGVFRMPWKAKCMCPFHFSFLSS